MDNQVTIGNVPVGCLFRADQAPFDDKIIYLKTGKNTAEFMSNPRGWTVRTILLDHIDPTTNFPIANIRVKIFNHLSKEDGEWRVRK